MGLARLYVLQERFEEALPLADEAVKRLPDSDLAQQLQSAAAAKHVDRELRARLKPGNTSEASEYSRRANEPPQDAGEITQEARSQRSKAYHAAIFENPYAVDAHIGLAEFLLSGRYDGQSALRHYKFSLLANPADVRARECVIELFKKSVQSRKAKDAVAALQILEELDPSPVNIERDRNWSDALLALAGLCMDDGLHDEAIDYYTRLEAIRPGTSVSTGLGQAYRRMKQYGRAIEIFEKLTDSSPQDGYMLLRMTYQEMDRHESALECFGKLAEHNPSMGLVLQVRAYAKLGRNGEAGAHLEKLLEYYKSNLDGQPSAVFRNAEIIIQVCGEWGKLDASYKFFQEMDGAATGPNGGTCGLAVYHERQREFDKAIPYFKRLADAEEKIDSPYRHRLVSMYMSVRNFDATVAEIERITEAGGRDAWLLQTLAFLEKYAKNSSDFPGLQERIDRLEERLRTRL